MGRIRELLKKYWKIFDLGFFILLVLLLFISGLIQYEPIVSFEYAVLCGMFYAFFIVDIKKSISNVNMLRVIRFLTITMSFVVCLFVPELAKYLLIPVVVFYLVFPVEIFIEDSVQKKIVKVGVACFLITLQTLMGVWNSFSIMLIGWLPFVGLVVIDIYSTLSKKKIYLGKYFLPFDYRQKKVSVVIPNYNYGRYLSERIESILKQTYPISELIILDDRSSDNSLDIIKEEVKKIEKKFPHVSLRVIENKRNSGSVFKQWEKAFEESSCEYVWIAEADDLCDKHFLCAAMRGFQRGEKVVISYTESLNIDEKGKVVSNDSREWSDFYNSLSWHKNFVKSGKEMIAEHLSINNSIPNVSSVVFRKKMGLNYGLILKEAQKFHLVGDWYFYEKVLLHGDVAYCKESLNYFRVHSNGVTRSIDRFVHLKEIEMVQQIITRDVKLKKEIECIRDNFVKDLKSDWGISNKELMYAEISFDDILKNLVIENEILLSIVIPVYNNEKYIRKCLDSVLVDLPPRTEIIIINDGSTDDSDKIIKEYDDKYREIRYIKQENGGLAAVKNVGLREARGEYVIFLDSDDYVSSNGYSTMLKEALVNDCDLVHCDFEVIYPDGGRIIVAAENRERTDVLERVLDCGLMASSCNKMVRKKMYSNLTFPEGLINEDVAVTPVILVRCSKIGYIDSPFYKYVQHEDSMNNTFSERRLDIFETTELCLERIKKENIYIRMMVEYYLVVHQLIAFLSCALPKIKNRKIRNEVTKKFCELFNGMKFLKNEQYLEHMGSKYVQDIVGRIKKCDYCSIKKKCTCGVEREDDKD